MKSKGYGENRLSKVVPMSKEQQVPAWRLVLHLCTITLNPHAVCKRGEDKVDRIIGAACE